MGKKLYSARYTLTNNVKPSVIYDKKLGEVEIAFHGKKELFNSDKTFLDGEPKIYSVFVSISFVDAERIASELDSVLTISK